MRVDDSPALPALYAALLVLGTSACTKDQIQLETDSAESGSEPTTAATATTGMTTITTAMSLDSSGDGGPVPTTRQVDILFVMDNSGSMGEEQASISRSLDALVDALNGANPPVDYRIAVTTTDNGNPWCQGTGPEAGMLRATSCRSRPTEFVFEGATTIDATQEACYDQCEMETLDISDPWVEVNGAAGTSNVPGNQVKEALRCMLPQGINGCGFESPLESLWKALRRSETDTDPSFGFVRAGSLPAVIIITDEADCSYNNDWETIFLPDGDRIFWSDQDAPAPTSAVCWNAGVSCVGSGTYDDCAAVDLNAVGDQVGSLSADSEAVLRPVSRYSDYLNEWGAYVIAINGVNPDGSVTYADSLDDPTFQGNFGIGPGCTSASGQAVPPVRLRETIAQVTGDGNMYSICSADYSAAFSAFADGILARLP